MSDQSAPHSGLGVASLVISIAAVGLLVVALIISTTPADDLVGSPEAIMLGIAATLAFGFAFAVFALGIAGLFQKEAKKLLATLGMVFSSVVIAVAASLWLLGLYNA